MTHEERIAKIEKTLILIDEAIGSLYQEVCELQSCMAGRNGCQIDNEY